MGKLYILRHGKDRSLLNRRSIHPAPNAELTNGGINQVAAFCSQLMLKNIEIILTSPIIRALQTAQIIQQQLKIKLVISDVFSEWRPASSVYGVSPDNYSPSYRTWKKERHLDPLTAYEDGESLAEMEERIHCGKQMIDKLKNKYSSILLVSHLVYLRGLIDLIENRPFNNGRHLFEPDNRVHLRHCQMIKLQI